MSQPPKKVYRYQKLNALTLEALLQDELYFASPASFNDPQDCRPTVEPDSDNATLRTLLRELMQRRASEETKSALQRAKVRLGPNALAHVQRTSAQEAVYQLAEIAYHSTNPEYEVDEVEAERGLLATAIEEELLRHYERGARCFSSTSRSPLLWSHYGDQHNGICVGYNMNRRPVPVLHQVQYGGNRLLLTSVVAKVILENDVQARAALDEAMLLRKAAAWRYKREWRLIGPVGPQDSCLELEDVTFGLRCPPALMHMVISALEGRDPSVRFYEMRQRRDSFVLQRRPVDINELQVYYPRTARSGIEIFGDRDS